MNKVIVSIFVLPVIIFSAESIIASSTSSAAAKPSRPIAKPIKRPGLVNQNNYYNSNTMYGCERYKEIIYQKDIEIETLQKELDRLNNQEQVKIQKEFKEEYDKEMQKFDNRKSDKTTKSQAIISNKPID